MSTRVDSSSLRMFKCSTTDWIVEDGGCEMVRVTGKREGDVRGKAVKVRV